MGRKVDKAQRAILIKFENQISKNLILENASKKCLKNSEVFKRIILLTNLSKKDRTEQK